MAHTDACKIQVTEFVKKLNKSGISISEACRQAEQESDGIPAETIRRWWKEIVRGYKPPTKLVNSDQPAATIEKDLETQKKPPHRPQKYPPPAKGTFNETNGSVDWARWTWNPVTGCRHGCEYCYSKDIANRFYPPEIGFNPHFYPNRLEYPQNTPVPVSSDIRDHLVFTVSMGDLFGEWVEQDWIDKVMDVVSTTPQWNYLFLTKNPQRLLTIQWPLNAWVGTTVDIQRRVDPAIEVFSQLQAPVKFLSCEPLLEELSFPDMTPFDWVIVGVQSNQGKSIQPEWAWVEKLFLKARADGCMVYFKPNLTIRPREYPQLSGLGCGLDSGYPGELGQDRPGPARKRPSLAVPALAVPECGGTSASAKRR